MQKERIFLQWALLTAVTLAVTFIAFALGWLQLVFASDPTPFTRIVLVVFIVGTVWTGSAARKLSKGYDVERVSVDLGHTRYAPHLCIGLGLLGTAVGYFIMLKGGSVMGDPQEVIRSAFDNAAVAIVNTVFGGICGTLLEVQGHILAQGVEHLRLDAERDESIAPLSDEASKDDSSSGDSP